MHLLLMTRGVIDKFEVWKKFMETQMFWWKRTNLKTNKDEYSKVQGVLRPIQLFEYVFPETSHVPVAADKDGNPTKVVERDNLKEVLAMMNLQNAFPLRPEVSSYAWLLRKMVGFKPIPKETINDIKGKDRSMITHRFVVDDNTGMAVYPLGIKKDVTQDFNFENGESYHQEGL